MIKHSSSNRIYNYEEETECPFCSSQIITAFFEDHYEICLLREQEAALTEKFICQSCFSSVLVSEKQTHVETCSAINKIKIDVQSMEEKIFPLEWGKNHISFEQKSSFLSLYKLDPKSNEFAFIDRKIFDAVQKNGLEVVEIDRIENKTLWRKYFEHMELIKSQNLNSGEGWLFHGTRAINPYIIAKEGFDISFSNDGGSLGRGLYFAKEPTYSVPAYCYVEGSYLYVFLCKVHCGNSFNAKNGKFYKPPLFDTKKGIYYDSVYNSQMVVVYENHKAYPFYLIKLKKKL